MLIAYMKIFLQIHFIFYVFVLGDLLNIKYISLVILTVQNASITLMLRYSRIVSHELYIASTAVAFSEVS